MSSAQPIVELHNLSKSFGSRALVQNRSFALGPVSIRVMPGEVVGVLGESGSGKSTVANVMMRLTGFDDGQYLFQGRDVTGFTRRESFDFKSKVQIIFQDPYGSLNPRATVGASVREALILHKPGMSRAQMDKRVRELFAEVGLANQNPDKYPHEFSGGQRQRIAIARALAVEPELLVCDEPLSSLDVSIQAQVLELFVSLIRNHNLTMVFISHDLNVSRLLCDRVYVMHEGKVVEEGQAAQVLTQPQHEYTARLLAAVY
ncbi:MULTISPECIES: ABC transporter ATP-binding protein [Kaistia]|uniref:ABC transporter ATP-binding protein n=1 Tax=Kaistia nematophila TaxID=2994654 RepID=A0A9X3IMJ2_9HYPH|nr:ABC transporter ATP-binding protein [Kaistia nematophila]MBN9026930.1 ABC transporter ATP-binding protein [Hyphomicrobiales bacterium]MCX5569945.1 ABC transporter ATP-binding protein [Kaistia nematophila]